MEIKEIISSGLLELYAMGIATHEEQAKVEECIALYPQVLDELKLIQSSLEEYAQSNGLNPSEILKEKVFSSIRSIENINPTPIFQLNEAPKNTTVKKINFAWKFAAAASVVLLIGSLIFNVIYYNKFSNINVALKITQEKLSSQQQAMEIVKQDMSIVQNKYSRAVELSGTEVAPEAVAKIFWMKNTGEVYIDPSNLPDVPQGKQYQLWAIVDDKPVSAGMILTSQKGDKYRIQKMKTFGAAQAFAITLEKEGGSEIPTMDKMYVIGKI